MYLMVHIFVFLLCAVCFPEVFWVASRYVCAVEINLPCGALQAGRDRGTWEPSISFIYHLYNILYQRSLDKC